MKRSYQTEKKIIDTSDGPLKLLILRPTGRTGAGQTGAGLSETERPPGILWIHGGGYVTGMAGMVYMSRALPLVKKYGAVVISPAYRLAGKAPYPAALKDCYAALLYLKTHAGELGVDDSRIMVGGESAGGGLTAAVCLKARQQGDVRIAFQMPLYPMMDDRDTLSSRANHGLVWNTRLNHRGWRAYLGPLYGEDIVPVTAAPARETDYGGLPPAYTFVGRKEAFFCETLTYIKKLQEAGVAAHCDIYETGMHAFDMLLPFRRVSRQAAATFEQQYLYAAAHYKAPQEER